jgi:uncharacterized protein (DUF362 family)
MSEESDSRNAEVAIVKEDTPKSTVLKGIEILGGISKFIKEGDQVFIKFNILLPTGFPTNTNFDVLETLITTCKKAGAGKIYLGSFPLKSMSIKSISNVLNLEEYFKNLGAEFIYLDNSNFFNKKNIKKDQLEKISKESFSKISINEKEFLIPKVIIDSDKLIIVNQINVNPLFKLNLSLLNSYSMVSPKYQEIENNKSQDINYVSSDQYKKDLISNILDVFTIKQPDLIINDLFFLLESSGPCIYRDSHLQKPSIIVLGNNAVSVDLITLKLLNIETQDYDLILEAHQRGLGLIDPKAIRLVGEDIDKNSIDVDLCTTKLEDIKLKNFIINSGQICSGCFEQAYHLLNLMKTHMIKDLKYNPRNAFLVGLNPSEPERFENVLLFGDCAIRSTKNSNFRKKRIISKKTSKKKKSPQKSREKEIQKKEKIKIKLNKNILELTGCPPDINDCLELIFQYYGKSNLPNLSLLKNLLETLVDPKSKEKLRIMGVI